jgi:hypothetical protein
MWLAEVATPSSADATKTWGAAGCGLAAATCWRGTEAAAVCGSDVQGWFGS